MYHKNQKFLNLYKEIKQNELSLPKSIISNFIKVANLNENPLIDLNHHTHENNTLTHSNYPQTPHVLYQFKEHSVHVKFSDTFIPYVNLSLVKFNDNNISEKTKIANNDNGNEKRTASYTPTVLLSNPILKPIP